MNDFAFVAIMLAFFAAAVVFVRLCDRIIGDEELALPGPTDAETADPAESVAA